MKLTTERINDMLSACKSGQWIFASRDEAEAVLLLAWRQANREERMEELSRRCEFTDPMQPDATKE